MTHSSRRTALKLMAGGTLAATGMAAFATTASAQEFVVTNNYQNFKRGKIDGLHPDRRILNITWEDMGRIKMRAADLVTNYSSLREGMIVDCNYFDYVDVLVAKKSAARILMRPISSPGDVEDATIGMQPVDLAALEVLVVLGDHELLRRGRRGERGHAGCGKRTAQPSASGRCAG